MAIGPGLQTIEITCPQCGHVSKQPMVWLADHASFRCPGCDRTIDVDVRDVPLSESEQRILEGLRGLAKEPRR